MLDDAAHFEWEAWKRVCVEFTDVTGLDVNDGKYRRLFNVLIPEWADKRHEMLKDREACPNGEEE